ncbi:transglycosylase SLT domain-containing protein [Xenorhabdus sp. KJ12.1]|uniref:transglycosylase SLT domain-containing protein n=1 Tax=Xenorhabdus sp. KJ12.1 TaxID=1851571 RepID=UPI000C045079|nr:transglycosylase SLT domain-containing protein [Xenorhabdus sp. KJ12.1]PHM67883.1 putative transglycosylase signal peptide protein [Xenorhabdus sp. KJ12.1]
MATLVDTLLVSLKLDMNSFASDANKATRALDDLDKKAGGASTAVVKLSDGVNEAADSTTDFEQSNQKLAKSTDNVGKSAKNTSNVVLNFSDNIKGTTEKTQDWDKAINGAVKALAGLFTTIFVSTGLTKLIGEISSANDKIYFLSKNLGMSAETIKKWQNVAEMSGGSADGMTATMSNLNKSLWDLVTVGDASILPFFNALGVGVVDSQGKLRHLDDILLDMADSMSQMERPQAYNIAKNMGMDDGTINTLLEGREAIQKKLDAQKDLVISTKEELELNRKLREQNAVLSQQWEGLKTLVANYLIPRLLKLSQMVTGFLDYLNKNRETVITLFQGMAAVIGITLIPVVARAALAVLALFAPLITGTGLIFAFIAALWLLYDDYKGWKEGKDSFFDWGAMHKSFVWIMEQLEKLEKWFKGTTIGKWFTDTNGELNLLKTAFAGFATYIAVSWVGKILKAFAKVGRGIKGIGKQAAKVGNKAGKLGAVGRVGAVGLAAGAAYASVDYVDAVLNSVFGEYDWFQRFRTAPNWKYAGMAAIGQGDARWVNGEWVDNRGKGTGHHITPTTLDIPTGDPDLDRRKRKVQRGEMTLDELNGVAPNANKLKGQAALNAMRGYFMELEKKEGLPAGWLYGVAMAESSGNRFEVSKKGAKGPFQFMPPTAKAYGLKGNDVFDWYKSSDAAAKMYGDLSRQFKGDIDKMLAGYNWGTGNMSKFGMKNMPKETRDYIQRVRSYREKELQDRKAQGVVQSLSDFQARMNQPIIPNMDMTAPHEFLAQTEKIRSMPMAGATNNVKVDLNGDINVVTSANTITGTVTDAGEAARLSLSQIMTSMG